MHGGWRKKLQMQPFFYKGMQGAVDERREAERNTLRKKKNSAENYQSL
jgi:hypothetical protein